MARPVPEFLATSTESTIRFTPADFGIMNERFSFAAENHGDGDTFSWTAGGGEKKYRVIRKGFGEAPDKSTMVNEWDIVIEDTNGVTLGYLHLDLPQGTLFDYSSDREASAYWHSEVADMGIDLAWEIDQPEYHQAPIMFRGGFPFVDFKHFEQEEKHDS